MLKFIYFLLSVSLSHGRVTILNSIKPKTIKSLKLGAAMGSAVGASVPAFKELTDIKKDLINIKARSENTLHELPSSYINHLSSSSSSSSLVETEWNYSKFIDSIYNNNIVGVSVHQDGKFAYVIENVHTKNHVINLNDIHHVTLIPLHTSTLINILIDNGVTFDIFT